MNNFISDTINLIVRKSAHFTAYLILAVLYCNAVRPNGIAGWKKYVITIAIYVLYAISDEIHQLFIAGRSGQPSDVILDSLGAVSGLGIFMLIERRFSKKKHLEKVT